MKESVSGFRFIELGFKLGVNIVPLVEDASVNDVLEGAVSRPICILTDACSPPELIPPAMLCSSTSRGDSLGRKLRSSKNRLNRVEREDGVVGVEGMVSLRGSMAGFSFSNSTKGTGRH